MGRRPRVFRCRSPKCESGCCLQVCTGLGQNPTGTKFRGYIHSTSRGHPRSLHPHYLSVYASNRDFEYLLIRSLQHSIPGAWLALTRTGFTPASQSDLASPHVHRMVRPSLPVDRGKERNTTKDTQTQYTATKSPKWQDGVSIQRRTSRTQIRS